MSVEQLKTKTTSQLAELGKKSDAINRLKIELGEKTATIFALEARDKALQRSVARHRGRARGQDRRAARSRAHARRQAGRARQDHRRARRALDARRQPARRDRRAQAPGRGAEGAAHRRRARGQGRPKTAATRERVELKAADRRSSPRSAARSRTSAAASPSSSASWWRRPPKPRSSAAASQELESRLDRAGARCSTERELELKQLRDEIDDRAARPRADLRAELAELDGRAASATESAQAEKALLEASSTAAQGRARPSCSTRSPRMKREAEQTWASERVENALLRERINDVAAEVARLTSALEGPNSPIDAILAAETARDRDALAPVDRRRRRRASAAAKARAISPTASARCRRHASRVPHRDEPTAATRRRREAAPRLRLTPLRAAPYIARPDGRALSSAGERSLHTGEVVGSIPTAPTISLRITCRFGGSRVRFFDASSSR